MQSIPVQKAQADVRVNEFIRSVYNWMAIGLALTGFTAYYVSHSESVLRMLFTVVGAQLRPTMLFYGLIVGELAMVFMLSARIARMQTTTATGLFVGYAVLNGATLSSIFLIYTSASITSTFFICSFFFLSSTLRFSISLL